jgi:hypothetical protein
MHTIDTMIGLTIIVTLVLALVAFGTMGITLRRTASKVFAWACFGIYLPVALIAVDLMFG